MQPSDPVPGWFAPVYQSLSQPMLTAGVPSDFFMMSVLGALALTFVWWPIWAVWGAVYAVAKRLTAWDSLWMGILSRYLGYAARYEG